MDLKVKDLSKYLVQMFDTIRVVDPLRSLVVDYDTAKNIESHTCYKFWNREEACPNCISMRAYQENQAVVKIEYNQKNLYWVMAAPVEIDGNKYIIETLKDITNCSIIENVENKTVVELKKEIERINALVVIDELTGCFNRRYLNERLEIDMVYSRENNKLLTVAMIDIDLFKSVNDKYGHLAGDYVLQQVAKLMKNRLKDTGDWVSRYGGEEFLVVVHNKSLEEVVKIIDTIRIEIADAIFTYEENKVNLRVTVSAGIAKFTESIKEKEQLINAADTQLYEAKNLGRNQIAY